MKKADLLILACVLALAGILYYIFGVSNISSNLLLNSKENTVTIKQGEELLGEYPLEEDRMLEIENTYGTNIIRIEAGEVWMEAADCPNQNCVQMGKKCKQGEVIVCLPHQLMITIH